MNPPKEGVMASNPIAELSRSGQSVWYDQMERKLLTSGTLLRMIEEDDLRGLTSNPTIFEKAIAGSDDYDVALEKLAATGKNRDEILETLMVADIGDAADIFRPVHDRTGRLDGFVSIEVRPGLAADTAGSISEAKKLWKLLGRPNVMIKIPATPEGIPAIEEVIASGINVNITLIFSREVYRQVIEAYLRGLERRVKNNESIDHIQSVASFFVSRIDAAVEKLLETEAAKATDLSRRRDLESLQGAIAIANAKMAYQLFKEVFHSPRFEALRKRGANAQRPLWASTGTKNPKYSDVLYVEQLIGSQTVNTVPPATYGAFKDHGKVKMTIETNLETAKSQLELLEQLGISLDEVTRKLTADGVKSFAQSFDSLVTTIDARRVDVLRKFSRRHVYRLGKHTAAFSEASAKVQKDQTISRIVKKDASLWKSEPEYQKLISNSLGWLKVAESVRAGLGELTSFAESIRGQFDRIVVLGMGGSSLCSEVMRRSVARRTGYPELMVLDSTDPAAVRAIERHEISRSLFMVASKSGGTTEPQMFHRYFYARVREKKGDRAGDNFIAVTDPGTQLESEAKRDRFRRIFLNPPDIGGRYSALSWFGMVPAAVAGFDVQTLLERAIDAFVVCQSTEVDANPGARLGAVLAGLAQRGLDKLTVVAGPPFDSVGLWIEQLVAESTGKEGKGIVPLAAEPLLAPQHYGQDRLFVWIHGRESFEDGETRSKLEALERAGHPIIEHQLESPLDLGEEFFIWEFATAVAGALMGINPFDQPNVQESKDNTKRLLEEFRSKGALPQQPRSAAADGIEVYGSSDGARSPEDALAKQLASIRSGDYVALMEFVAEDPKYDRVIASIREELMKAFRVATTSGYGPRFLHSTGQLHKGGPDKGVFIQITAAPAEDVAIPGELFSFGILEQAQALGDFQSLTSRGRRVLRFHFTRDAESGLRKMLAMVQAAAPAPSGAGSR